MDSETFPLRLPTKLYKQAAKQAERENRSIANLIRLALIEYLARTAGRK